LQAEGEFALVQQRLEPALGLSGQPVKRGTMAHEHIVYMMLVDSAALVEDKAAIRRYAPRLEELARRDDHRPYLAVAQRAWGIAHRLAGEYSEAETLLHKAADLFTELDARWQVGRTFFEMGKLELERSNPDLAKDYFDKALGAFEELRAQPDADRVRAEEAKLLDHSRSQ
jgi:tetratricopeptide (TPR) repeat protein